MPIYLINRYTNKTIHELQQDFVSALLRKNYALAQKVLNEIERRAERNGRLKTERMAIAAREFLKQPTHTQIPTPSRRELLRLMNQPIYNKIVQCLQNNQIDVAEIFLKEIERRAERNGRLKTIRLAKRARYTFQEGTRNL